MPRIGLHLTDRCQLDCDHCVRDPGQAPIDLALETIEVVLRDAARDHGVRRASLTGGEPTLHPRFPEILDAILRHGMTWDMVTNGRRFERVAEWLASVPERGRACGRVAFSVDGATDATHDSIRGAGQRREVLAAMALCVAERIPFATTTTLHARNVDEIEAIAEDCTALGAQYVRFAVVQPTGTHLDASLELAPAAWHVARARILALSPRLPVRLAEGWPRDETAACGALRGETLHVDQEGRLTLCCAHSQAPGDADGHTIAGSVAGGLAGAMRRLDEIRRVTLIAREEDADDRDPWAKFGCNRCLKGYGRPHWTARGTDGAAALRARWRGAWARSPDGHVPSKKFLPVAP